MLRTMILFLLSFSLILSEYYEIGSIMSIEDQNQEFDICYGDYQNETFKFSDFNGALNGGNYKVILVRMNATW